MGFPPQSDFQPLPNRDAWGTIRGFVYQVDITILRWLDLKGSERLALECGEDVDRVSPIIDTQEKIEYFLEQVKYRDRNITLRSSEAVEAIASFHAEKKLNPGLPLRFRFLSNASPGQEKPRLSLTAPSGILLWSELQRNSLSPKDTETAVRGIRNLLQAVPRPEGFNQERWDGFQAFLADCRKNDLLGLIREFEWGLGAGDINEVQTLVRDRLIQSGRAAAGGDVQRKHTHLFVHVIRVLTKPGQKSLTVEDLDRTLTVEALATADERILQRLEDIRALASQIAEVKRAVHELHPKVEEGIHISREILEVNRNIQESVGQIRSAQGSLGPQLAQIAALIDGLLKRSGIAAPSAQYSELEPIETEPPPVVSAPSRREQTIKALASRVGERTWCALHGTSGAGKTQLGALIILHTGAACLWPRIRDLNPTEAARRISLMLNSVSPRRAEETRQEWLNRVCSVLGLGTIIVLDDLPYSDGHSDLDELLVHLCRACRSARVSLISMAHRPLPTATRSSIAEDLHEEVVPPLVEAEIQDIFLQYRAPGHFVTPRSLQVVRLATLGHPVLVVEAARFLNANGWTSSGRSLEAILSSSYAEGIGIRTIDDIRRTVRDDDARELLYRIKLIGWSFTEEQVQWVGDVSPAVRLPLERFADLVGLWVQQDASTHYIVSPLISSLKGSNLPEDRQKLVHLALADGIMRERKLGPETAFRAIHHFSSAERYNNAAGVLLLALNGMSQVDQPIDHFGITSIWTNCELPSSIDHGIKLLVRSMQIVLRRRMVKDVGYLLSDLDRLMAEEEPEAGFEFVEVGVAGLLAATFGWNDPVRALDYLVRGIRATRNCATPPAEIIATVAGWQEGLLELLWMIGAHINDDRQFESWFASVRELTPEEAQRADKTANASTCSELVCNGIWMRAAEASSSDQDWTAVMAKLDRLRIWALATGVKGLAVYSLRGQIIVAAEYIDDLARAMTLTKTGLSEHANDVQAQFLISEIMARQFYYQHRNVEALHWFEKAFSSGSGEDLGAQTKALILAGAAAAGLSSTVSLTYLRRAVMQVHAVPKDGSQGLLSAQVWGELAIALWSQGDCSAGYEAWKCGIEELLKAKDDTDNWKILFQIMGNCSGYFAYIGESQGPASWPYAVPVQGMLLNLPREVLPLYKSGRDWQIFAQLALMADAVGAYQDAVAYSVRITGDPEQLAPGMGAFVRRYRLPRLLDEGRLAEVIAEAVADAQQQTWDEGWAHDRPPGGPQGLTRFREHSSRLDLVAVAIELARRRLTDSQSAGMLTGIVIDACRQAVESRGASSWWTEAADAIKSFTLAEPGWRTLYERGAGLMNSDSYLGLVYYVAAMLKAGPADAVQLQMAVVPWLRSHFSRTLFHFTLSSLAAEYWAWALKEYPAHFGSRRLIQSDLETAFSLQGEERLRVILRTVNTSLGTEPQTREIKDWLFGRR